MDLWEVYVQLSVCLWKFKCCHNKIVKEAKKKKKPQRKERKEEGAGEGERRGKK